MSTNTITSLMFKTVAIISGNDFAQTLLGKLVNKINCIRGIGTGGYVFTSGERVVFDVLHRQCQPPYCIFDVGGHQGAFVKLILDNIATDRFTIHCFEPSVRTFQILQHNLPEDPRLNLNNLGLYKEKNQKIFYYDAPYSGRASLTKMNLQHRGIEFEQFETVQLDTLDSYCAAKSINKINLLKIDVEGHELDVLKGAQMMFEKKAVDIVMFEFGKCHIDTHYFLKDFYYFFHQLNMQMFRITPSEYLYPIKHYQELDEQFNTTNFIVLPNQ